MALRGVHSGSAWAICRHAHKHQERGKVHARHAATAASRRPKRKGRGPGGEDRVHCLLPSGQALPLPLPRPSPVGFPPTSLTPACAASAALCSRLAPETAREPPACSSSSPLRLCSLSVAQKRRCAQRGRGTREGRREGPPLQNVSPGVSCCSSSRRRRSACGRPLERRVQRKQRHTHTHTRAPPSSRPSHAAPHRCHRCDKPPTPLTPLTAGNRERETRRIKAEGKRTETAPQKRGRTPKSRCEKQRPRMRAIARGGQGGESQRVRVPLHRCPLPCTPSHARARTGPQHHHLTSPRVYSKKRREAAGKSLSRNSRASLTGPSNTTSPSAALSGAAVSPPACWPAS